ncbi:MAG: LarC family nickel insertion protein [Candidatus Fimadaptatus sp.]
MSQAYFDCAQGASAALMLSALSAAHEACHAAPDAYRLPRGMRLRCIHALEGDAVGRSVELELPEGMDADRELSMAELEGLTGEAALRPAAAARARRVLETLGRALEETRVSARRSVQPRQRGFTLRAAAAFIALMQKLDALGVEEIYYSPVNAGGRMPCPEVAHMAAEGGMRVFMTPGAGELLTPDGAAVLAALGSCRSVPAVPECSGRGFDGAGGELSVLLGRAEPERTAEPSGDALEPGRAAADVIVIECNIDDMTPEQLAYACERLMEEGALDVWQTPIVMKKGRMAAQLSVLCAADRAEGLAEIVLRETTTLGVRMAGYARRVLPRSVRTVDTRFGPIRIKSAPGKAAPEYEDCRQAARAGGAPIMEVYEAARGAAGTP